MTPEFAKLVDPIFLSVLRLVQRLENDERVDIQTERSNVRTLIDDAAKRVERPGSSVRPEEFELAKYGLVCWIDEIITTAHPQWESIKLEVEYWGPPGKRAFRFYVEGESKARHSTPDVVEIWYLALALGFKGDIRGAFKNQLNREPPGGGTDPNESRAAWARELASRMRQTRLPDFAGEPLHCDVPPLKGRSLLAMGSVTLALSLTIMGVILSVWHSPTSNKTKPSRQSGTVTTPR
jgi:type VI secretion system protein ImpK